LDLSPIKISGSAALKTGQTAAKSSVIIAAFLNNAFFLTYALRKHFSFTEYIAFAQRDLTKRREKYDLF
jgi:hypothetical protein